LYDRLDLIVKRFVGKSYPCVGVIPWDAAVGDGIRARRPVLEYAPRSAAAICIREMAGEVVRRGRSGGGGGDIRDLLERIAGAGVSRSEEEQA
jgi:MinD-like ATPase involved in chromosome partitioning or flagellar assembly